MINEKNKKSDTEIEDAQKVPFHSLSPISDKEKHKYYCDALEWALTNRKDKDIKNIALTGTYGSGKSSILKTFQERKIENLKFLKISLATFKEEKRKKNKVIRDRESKSPTTQDNSKIAVNSIDTKTNYIGVKTEDMGDQLRLIELSILQQIFYHEKNDNIPDSRFKKVRSLKPNEVKNATWLVFGVICSFYLFFYFDTLRTLVNIPEPKIWFGYIIKTLILAGFLVLFYFFLKKVIHFSQRLTISKLNFQNLEIQVAETLDKSILNNHLDEILYFFEATDYNVVIIEDLDRFEQTEIFTKLREINLLINNSKSIQRDVTFIYAVRDEMFKDNDRTKFFDFIIPVIPVINYSNSNVQLTKALEEFNYSISEELIDEVAFYVDDMRLLYNIVNEFHIYFQKFQGEEFMDKLFAVIVYKNIYPEDFVKLGRNKGILYKSIVVNKLIWIKESIQEIEKKNLILKHELAELEKTLPKNINELKRIYLLEYIMEVSNFSSFRIQSTNYSISKMLEEDNFEKLIDGAVTYNTTPYNQNETFPIKFSQVEAKIDSKQGYLGRKSQIESRNSGKIQAIRNSLKINDEEIRNVKSAKVKYLLRDKKFSISSKPSKQEQLIILLIRNGYIAEDYLNYISYFYPGSITENDHWFLMNVRNEAASNFDYKLDEVENVIKKISDSEFEKSFVLNYTLLNYLVDNQLYETKKEIILKQLSNESEDSIKFIKAYINESKDLTIFVKGLCNVWVNIWNFIEQDNSFSEEERLKYYYLILNSATISDIKKIASVSELEFFISKKSDFLSFIGDSQKVIDIIDLFRIKFTSINFDNAPEEIQKYVYENNNYALNPHMLELMIKTFGQFNKEDFITSNYAAIKLSKCDLLNNYVDNNIEQYIESVYLKLENNKQEQIEFLMNLLNNSEIMKSIKERILLFTDTLIESISDLENPIELIDFLLENQKIEANWSNIIFAFEEDENNFSEILTNFLNEPTIARILRSKVLGSKEKNYTSFRRGFLLNNSINEELYSLYIDAFPFTYTDLKFETLSESKVKALVDSRKLNFTLENYNKLKSTFEPLHLIFASNNLPSFFKVFSELDLSELEMIELLETAKIDTSNKIKLIGMFDEDNPITEIKLLSLLGNASLEYNSLKLSVSTISSILLNSLLKQDQKIELFVRKVSIFNDDFIQNFLNSLGGNYKQLNEKGPMPSFKKSDSLVLFFNHLKATGKISKIKNKGNMIKVTTFRN